MPIITNSSINAGGPRMLDDTGAVIAVDADLSRRIGAGHPALVESRRLTRNILIRRGSDDYTLGGYARKVEHSAHTLTAEGWLDLAEGLETLAAAERDENTGAPVERMDAAAQDCRRRAANAG